jgi:hypothetical protein
VSTARQTTNGRGKVTYHDGNDVAVRASSVDRLRRPFIKMGAVNRRHGTPVDDEEALGQIHVRWRMYTRRSPANPGSASRRAGPLSGRERGERGQRAGGEEAWGLRSPPGVRHW